MNFIRIDLTLMEFLDVFETIKFYSQLVIPCFEDLLSNCMSIGVSAKGSFMDFFDKHVCFVSIQTSEQDHVVISYVKYIPIKEELGCQSSECFLVST